MVSRSGELLGALPRRALRREDTAGDSGAGALSLAESLLEQPDKKRDRKMKIKQKSVINYSQFTIHN